MRAATRANSTVPRKPSGGGTARRGLLYLLTPLDFQRTLDAAIAVRRRTLRLEECGNLLWNSHAKIVPLVGLELIPLPWDWSDATSFGTDTHTCRFHC
jgi:hypothetical protein